MADTLRVTITSTAAKYKDVPKDKSYRVYEDKKTGLLVPRDCTYPRLNSPKDIARSAVKIEPPKVEVKPVDPKPVDPKIDPGKEGEVKP